MNLMNQIEWLPSLLDGVIVPAPLDSDKLKTEIVMQCGLLTPLYSEPETMKSLISHWFGSRTWMFEHLIKVIQAEYSPIENVDRYDSTTTSTISSESESSSESSASTRDKTGASGRDRGNDRSRSEDRLKAGNMEGEVSAFNASAYQPSTNTDTSESESILDSETILESESYSDSESEHISGGRTATGDKNSGQVTTFVQHLHGNIGVTTNFQLIEGELALLNKFNVYKWIAFQLRSEFFLEIY